MKLPKGLTIEDVMEYCEDGTVGFCMSCGELADGVEPDAERYECDNCQNESVYGAEQIIIMCC